MTEVLPEVERLSRLDKIRLIQFLAQEPERDEGGLIQPGQSYPVWSPDRAFTAAAALLQALEAEKAQPWAIYRLWDVPKRRQPPKRAAGSAVRPG